MEKWHGEKSTHPTQSCTKIDIWHFHLQSILCGHLHLNLHVFFFGNLILRSEALDKACPVHSFSGLLLQYTLINPCGCCL